MPPVLFETRIEQANFRGLNVILPKLATTLMPRDGDVGATTFKDGCQFAQLDLQESADLASPHR